MTRLAHRSCSASFLTLAVWLASPATAQQVSSADTDPQDVVVTARKRAERAQDVPVSVSVVSSADLVRNDLNSLKDILPRVPGVVFEETAPGLKRVAVRGVTAGNSGNPLVGFTIDDVPVGSSTFIGFGSQVSLDLDPSVISQIEILRGPQGTLYGASTMGGLIKYETVVPSLTATSGYLSAEGSAAAHGDAGFAVRGAVSAPLVTDRFAVQLSGFYRHDPGFIHDPVQHRDDVNALRSYGGRAAISGDLTDTIKLKASAIYQHSAADGTSNQDNSAAIVPVYGLYQHGRLPGTDGYSLQSQFYDLVLDKDVGGVTLSSLTGYNRLDYTGVRDLSQLYAAFGPTYYKRSDLGEAFTNHVVNKKVSEEVRLASNGDRRLGFIAGLFYTHEDSTLTQFIVPVGGTSGVAIPGVLPLLYSTFPTTYDEYSAFLNLTYKFSGVFDVELGGRISHNDQTLVSNSYGYLGSGSAAVASFTTRSNGTPFTFSVAPRLHLNPDSMLYARVASGYRAGGPNTNAPGSGTPDAFGADRTYNYELGYKGVLLDRKVTLDLALFYIDWQNIQSQVTDPNTGLQYYTNAGTAHSKGVEAAVTVHPLAGLDVALNGAYTDAKIINAANSGAYVLPGFRLPYVAKFSGTAAVDYHWRMGSIEPYIGASTAHVGDRDVDFVARAGRPRVHLPSFQTVDLRAGAQIGRFDVSLFAKNVGDARGYVGSTPITNTGPFAMTLISPRTVGGSLAVHF